MDNHLHLSDLWFLIYEMRQEYCRLQGVGRAEGESTCEHALWECGTAFVGGAALAGGWDAELPVLRKTSLTRQVFGVNCVP